MRVTCSHCGKNLATCDCAPDLKEKQWNEVQKEIKRFEKAMNLKHYNSLTPEEKEDHNDAIAHGDF